MTVPTLSIRLVSLQMNFSAFASPETISEVGIDKRGYALLKGPNGVITITKLIPNPECPAGILAVPRPVQLTLALSEDDSVQILPFNDSPECDAVQIAPLYDRARSDDLVKPLQRFLAQPRPICSGTIFSLRVGGEERLFMFGKVHPVDRAFSSKSTRVFVIPEPGPVLPRPSLAVTLPSLALDPAVASIFRDAFHGPSSHFSVCSRLKVPVSTGAIVHGPPGSGKTSLLSATAGTLKIPSIYCACRRYAALAAAELTEKLQSVFGFAADKDQCLVMLDDIDTVLKPLSQCRVVSERRKIAAFVSMLDDAMSRNGVFVIATATSLENVDECLVREGRLEHDVELRFPTLEQRQTIVKMNTGGMRIDRDDLREIAENMGDARSAKEIEELCRCAVYEMIEEVTGSSRAEISDSLLVYALNTKMRAVHFGIKEERRRRHHRHRRSHRPRGYADDDDSDEEDGRRRKKRSRLEDDDSDDEDRRRSGRRYRSGDDDGERRRQRRHSRR